LVDALIEASTVNETNLLEEFQEAGDGHSIVLGDESEKALLGGGFHNDVEGELVSGLVEPAPDLQRDVANAIAPANTVGVHEVIGPRLGVVVTNGEEAEAARLQAAEEGFERAEDVGVRQEMWDGVIEGEDDIHRLRRRRVDIAHVGNGSVDDEVSGLGFTRESLNSSGR
jgi:hypothetical protein